MRISDWSSDVCSSDLILTMGLPYICPYNVNSVMNPILVMCLGLGYFFNMYRGQPLVREGGVVIMSHPTPWEFNPVHHPSYIDFFEQVLTETTDPAELEARFEKQFAEDEWYRHLYRTSYAYHGVHPRSEEHTSELQSLMRISYAVFCLKKKNKNK